MEVKGNGTLPPNLHEARMFPVKAPRSGLTMSPGQVVWVPRRTCSFPETDRWKVTVKVLEGTSASSPAAPQRAHWSRRHVCACCPVRGCWKGCVCQHQVATAPAQPLLLSHGDPTLMASCSLALHLHLVKRSKGLGPRLSSGAGQGQLSLKMLLLRQVKDPAPGPREQ